MTVWAEMPQPPSELLPNLVTTLGRAALAGLSYPQLTIETKQQLACFGIYGSEAANVPAANEAWGSYRDRTTRGRMLDRLGQNTDEAMAEIPEYAQAREEGVLGLTMAMAWLGIRGQRSSGVYVASPKYDREGNVQDGVVTSAITSFTFAKEHESTMLHTQLQGVLNTFPTRHPVRPLAPSPGWINPSDPWDPAWIPPKRKLEYREGGVILEVVDPTAIRPTPQTLEVINLNEYDRIVNEAISVLIRSELAEIGIVLPSQKVPLEDWLETTTLHPEIEAWLRAIAATYRKRHDSGFVVADYVDDPSGERLKPGRRAEITATDPMAEHKTLRDQKNGLIHSLPARGGDSRYNQEQHPNRHQRLAIEKRVYLRRTRPPKPGEPYYSPSLAKPLNILQRAGMEIQQTWSEVRENPKKRLPELASKVFGEAGGNLFGGIADAGVSAGLLLVKSATSIWRGTRDYGKDIIGFWRQKRHARTRLRTIYRELDQIQRDIQTQRRPDTFPNSRLPRSKQLTIIRLMTSMMHEKLGNA